MFRILIVTTVLASASFFACTALDCGLTSAGWFDGGHQEKQAALKCKYCSKAVSENFFDECILRIGILFSSDDAYVLCKACLEQEASAKEKMK